jgi:hypothetical protein
MDSANYKKGKKMKKSKVIPLVFLISLLIITFTGCGSVKTEKPYIIELNGQFHATDIKLAQSKVPFTLYIPKYLPKEMGNNYPYQINGPASNETSDIEITIEYKKYPYYINISEINSISNWWSSAGSNPVYLDINGIKVLKEDSNSFSLGQSISGWNYHWDHNGITFNVGIFSFKEDECRKVINSIIQQY